MEKKKPVVHIHPIADKKNWDNYAIYYTIL